MRIFHRSILGPLFLAGTLLLTACPQMTTSPMGSPGGPLSAGGEDKTVSEKTTDSEDAIAPPSAAAPIPPPAAPGGGGDPAGTTPPPMEGVYRRIDGSGVGGDAPIPVADSVASADRGLMSAPTSREGVITMGYAVRVVKLPPLFHNRCQDIDCVRQKARSCEIQAETLAATTVKYPELQINYDALPGSFGIVIVDEGPWKGYPPSDIPKVVTATEPGYYLFFVRKREIPDPLGDSDAWSPVSTCSELASLVDDPRVDYVGDKLVPLVYLLPYLPSDFYQYFQTNTH